MDLLKEHSQIQKMISNIDIAIECVLNGDVDVRICGNDNCTSCVLILSNEFGQCPVIYDPKLSYLFVMVGFCLWDNDTFKAVIYLNLLKSEMINRYG